MAELIIKIGTNGPDPGWQDGDICHCFNDRRIHCTHAEHICHVGNFGFTKQGLRPDSLAKKFYEHTHVYKFTRVSATEIERLNLVTLAVDRLGAKSNKKGERMNVQYFIDRRRMHKDHLIFGVDGAEFWYGGQKDLSAAKVGLIWNDIETDTPLRMVDHGLSPMSVIERTLYIGMKIEDVSDAQAESIQASVSKIITDPIKKVPVVVMVKRRSQFIPYRGLPTGILSAKEQADIQNPRKSVEARQDSKRVPLAHIRTKR